MLFIGLRHWLSGNLLNYDVVECVRGSFGPDCEWTCDSCQNGASCNHDNPGCLCAPGWQGFLCNQTCPLVPWLHILYLLYGHLYNLVFGYNFYIYYPILVAILFMKNMIPFSWHFNIFFNWWLKQDSVFGPNGLTVLA